MEEKYICKFCRKICKNIRSLRNHERLCKLNPNRQFTKFSDLEWQKHKIKNGGTNQYIKARLEGRPIPKYPKHESHWLGKHHSEETKRKISEKLCLNNHGGRCKWYNYNGTYVQGTWELSIAKKLDSFSIFWIKTKTKQYILKYIDDNKKEHTYNPDFYLSEYNCFLEIKGYWWGNDKRKMTLVMNQHPDIKIIIIEKEKYSNLLLAKTRDEFIKILFD